LDWLELYQKYQELSEDEFLTWIFCKYPSGQVQVFIEEIEKALEKGTGWLAKLGEEPKFKRLIPRIKQEIKEGRRGIYQ
jgi:hypothetical protein